jgi:hypothetical protein
LDTAAKQALEAPAPAEVAALPDSGLKAALQELWGSVARKR